MSAGLPASCTSSYQNSTGTTIAAVTTIVASQWKVTAQGAVVAEPLLKELVALERAALDRWITLDPGGCLDLYAPELTYFDVTTEKRIDGREALEQRLAPLKNMKLPFTDPRYEIIDPKVQRHGDAPLLTFHRVNYGKLPGRPEGPLSRWNAYHWAGFVLQGEWRP